MEFKTAVKPAATKQTGLPTFRPAGSRFSLTSCVQRVAKLILGRQENTRFGPSSYRSKHLSATDRENKSKRVLNTRPWDINKNAEWIRTGKVASTGFDSSVGKDAGAMLGTNNRGIFKIITSLDPTPTSFLTNGLYLTIEDSLVPAHVDTYGLTSVETTENKFLRYVHAYCSSQNELFNDNQYTVLAQEIQQLINSNYIFRTVPSFKKTWGDEVLMAFPNISSYDDYLDAKKGRQDTKTDVAPGTRETRAAFKARL